MQKSQNRKRRLAVAALVIACLIGLYAAAGFLAAPGLLAGLARDTVRTNYGRDRKSVV